MERAIRRPAEPIATPAIDMNLIKERNPESPLLLLKYLNAIYQLKFMNYLIRIGILML